MTRSTRSGIGSTASFPSGGGKSAAMPTSCDCTIKVKGRPRLRSWCLARLRRPNMAEQILSVEVEDLRRARRPLRVHRDRASHESPLTALPDPEQLRGKLRTAIPDSVNWISPLT